MNRLLLILVVAGVAWTTSCSGGSSVNPPPPPATGFSNASLKGSYVFSMTGTTLDNTFGTSSFSRVGVFIADGGGGILATGGVQDVQMFGGHNNFNITGGSYVVNSDGRGTLNLTDSIGTVQYSIALISSTGGYLVDMITGETETASGSFSLQSATAMATGTYAFDFSGIVPDNSGDSVSIVGDLIPTAVGSGTFATNSFWDVNDAGVLSGKTPISGGSYASDGSGTGRGIANIGGLDFVYYVIDSQHVEFMGIDADASAPGTILGAATAQLAGTPNDVSAFNSSSFVFVIGGSNVSDGGPHTRAARLTATGGALSAILLDDNNEGSVTSVPATGVLNTGTVTLDGDGSGRGTFTFTQNASNTFTFIFYLSSATTGVIQDVSSVTSGGLTTTIEIADGTLLAQTGAPFSSSSLATNYAFNWSGVSTSQEDFVGQFAPATASPNGQVDFNEFGQGTQFVNNPFNGVITFGADGGTGSMGNHNTFVAGISGTPSTTINYWAYVANPSTILVMGTQNGGKRLIAGVLTAQTP
jgi:hypothetical protein